VGLATLIFASGHYLQTRRTIESDSYVAPGATLVAFTVVIVMLAIASIVLLLQMGE
jgi:uncharacterized membrane protein YidH (DUF202 family)